MADGGADARTNEGFTITGPNVAPGTAGLMQLVFFLSGDATVHDVNGNGVPGDNFVSVNLFVFKDPSEGSNGTEEAHLVVSVPNGGAVVPGTGPGRFIANVNFEYDTPFNLLIVLRLGVRSDATFTFLPNGNLVRTGGIVEVVEGDFANSVDLHQVFIPVGSKSGRRFGLQLRSTATLRPGAGPGTGADAGSIAGNRLPDGIRTAAARSQEEI